VADTLQRERVATSVPGSRRAVHAATGHLLEQQDERGWWSGELETNVTMTAEHVLLLAFLGLPHDDIREGAIRHLLGCQREDGSWGLYHDAPADLSTTIEAYVALRVLGLDGARDELRRALRIILEQGGVAHARVFTKIWLALFGAYPWEGVPSMPPELVWLPPSVPLNLYDFACWARGTIAPLLIVISRRPRRPLPFSLAEVVSMPADPSPGPTDCRSSTTVSASNPGVSRPDAGWSAGSATARRPTAAGEASNLRGCTRSSPCTSRGCRSSTR
jgi:squalene-hopene/tetraprenyl-beta-curcumene cyclase